MLLLFFQNQLKFNWFLVDFSKQFRFLEVRKNREKNSVEKFPKKKIRGKIPYKNLRWKIYEEFFLATFASVSSDGSVYIAYKTKNWVVCKLTPVDFSEQVKKKTAKKREPRKRSQKKSAKICNGKNSYFFFQVKFSWKKKKISRSKNSLWKSW